MKQEIRAVLQQDLEALKQVLDSSGLFPSRLLKDMIADYFDNPSSQDLWFTTLEKGVPTSIAYCAPEKFTEGTYNLYAIAVRKEQQGKGIGRAMMDHIEGVLRQRGHRILLVETSGATDFELTREFYLKCGYTKEAIIREFWSKGEDKVIFWKKLN